MAHPQHIPHSMEQTVSTLSLIVVLLVIGIDSNEPILYESGELCLISRKPSSRLACEPCSSRERESIFCESQNPPLISFRLCSEEIIEYCQLEKFTAVCPENEVIVVSTGQYGRMQLGRCVRKGYGSLGCSSDVLMQMDRLCSGREQCAFDVATLHGRQPCPTDLTPFLEARYYCQPTIPGVPQGCTGSDKAMNLKQTSGYISNYVTMHSPRGSLECPWRIQVPEGQRVNITLVNFARVTLSNLEEGKYGAGKPNICYQYAQFMEKDTRMLTECEGGNRLVHAYLSSTNVVDVAILTKKEVDVYFMLYFEAVGCPNPSVSPAMWVQRSVDSATVKCNSTGDIWNLKCIGREWHGDIGNCTLPSVPDWHVGTMFEGEGFPYSILIVVAIGVALGVFLGGILLVCASKYFKRRREDPGRTDTFQPSLYGVEHGKVLASQFDDVGGGSPRHLHYHGVHVDEATLTPSEKQCKCTLNTMSSYGPPPGYHPASQTSSHMYESPQFDRKDSR